MLAASTTLLAQTGPIILGGDDLDDHGSRSGSNNITGWLYAEKAIESMLPQISRGGSITHDIAAIGPSNPGNGVYPGGDSGGMINSVANVLGLSVLWVDSGSDVDNLFANIGNGSVNPRILWIVSDQAFNDLDTAEETQLALYGAEIRSFQQSGGGLMSHDHGYAWLTELLPDIVLTEACDEDGGTLTAEGQAAFPGLTYGNVSSGPCHSSFSGDLGGLDILALDGGGLSFIIGGGAGIRIGGGEVQPVPVLSPIGLATLLIGFLAFGLFTQRRRLN